MDISHSRTGGPWNPYNVSTNNAGYSPAGTYNLSTAVSLSPNSSMQQNFLPFTEAGSESSQNLPSTMQSIPGFVSLDSPMHAIDQSWVNNATNLQLMTSTDPLSNPLLAQAHNTQLNPIGDFGTFSDRWFSSLDAEQQQNPFPTNGHDSSQLISGIALHSSETQSPMTIPPLDTSLQQVLPDVYGCSKQAPSPSSTNTNSQGSSTGLKGGRRRNSTLSQTSREHVNKMREIGCCWPCILRRDSVCTFSTSCTSTESELMSTSQCGVGDPCPRCCDRSISKRGIRGIECTRIKLKDLQFVPGMS